MAPFVHFSVMGMPPARSVLNGMTAAAAVIEVGAQLVVVESFVTDQRLKIETSDQRLDANAVVALAEQQHEADEMSRASAKAMMLMVRPPRDRPTA